MFGPWKAILGSVYRRRPWAVLYPLVLPTHEFAKGSDKSCTEALT